MLITVVLGCATGAGVGQVTICGAVWMTGAVSMNSTVSIVSIWIGPRNGSIGTSVVTRPGQSTALCVVTIGAAGIAIGWTWTGADSTIPKSTAGTIV